MMGIPLEMNEKLMDLVKNEMRERLPDRRSSVNEKITFTTASGGEQHVNVTFGFDPTTNCVREVFTASLKVGSDTNAIVSDACVMLSLLMQHGYAPRQI